MKRILQRVTGELGPLWIPSQFFALPYRTTGTRTWPSSNGKIYKYFYTERKFRCREVQYWQNREIYYAAKSRNRDRPFNAFAHAA